MQGLNHSSSSNKKLSKSFYITKLLPHLLYQPKKNYLPLFKEAKNKK